MTNGGGETCEAADLAVYAELQPIDRHRSFIDHLFVLRDRGRLTGAGRNLFASPFSELVLVGRRPNDGNDNDAAIAWRALHLPPRFGRQPRQRSFARLHARGSMPAARSQIQRRPALAGFGSSAASHQSDNC